MEIEGYDIETERLRTQALLDESYKLYVRQPLVYHVECYQPSYTGFQGIFGHLSIAVADHTEGSIAAMLEFINSDLCKRPKFDKETT